MKKKDIIKKLAASLFTAAVLVTTVGGTVAYAEELPYDTYNYTYWEDIALTPAAYVPTGTVTGLSVGTTN